MRDARHSIERIKEVFFAFLVLGLTSFGGPIAHLGYFRAEFVTRRRWLSEADYADLVALCQFLPGPASSQVGFALGLLRGGGWGAAAAWTAFTLPSALVLLLFASGAASFDGPVSEGLLHGLKVAAVAIVAHAVWGMAHKLCPDQRRAGIALAAVLIVVLIGGPAGMIAAILAGAVGGMLLCRDSAYRDQVRRDQGDPALPGVSPRRPNRSGVFRHLADRAAWTGLGVVVPGAVDGRCLLPCRCAGLRGRACGAPAAGKRGRPVGLGNAR